MENVMVVFSSTDIPDKLVKRAIELTKERQAELIILDVRDKEMGEKVANITENLGFMGEKVVGALRKEITHGRCGVIYRKLSLFEEKANANNIRYEIVVEKGPYAENILKVARSKKVKTIICQKGEKIGEEFRGFEVVRV